jgi:hypothetical protein
MLAKTAHKLSSFNDRLTFALNLENLLDRIKPNSKEVFQAKAVVRIKPKLKQRMFPC